MAETAIVEQWMKGSWTPDQMGVILVAETMANVANRQRPWWRRRDRSPAEFLEPARSVVTSLLVAGWRPEEYGTSGDPS